MNKILSNVNEITKTIWYNWTYNNILNIVKLFTFLAEKTRLITKNTYTQYETNLLRNIDIDWNYFILH